MCGLASDNQIQRPFCQLALQGNNAATGASVRMNVVAVRESVMYSVFVNWESISYS